MKPVGFLISGEIVSYGAINKISSTHISAAHTKNTHSWVALISLVKARGV